MNDSINKLFKEIYQDYPWWKIFTNFDLIDNILIYRIEKYDIYKTIPIKYKEILKID